MPTEDYRLLPTLPLTYEANTIAFGGSNNPNTGGMSPLIFGANKFGVVQHYFGRFGLQTPATPIQPRATITDAALVLQSTAAKSTAFNSRLSLAARDGLWNAAGNTGAFNAPTWDSRFRALDTGAGTLVTETWNEAGASAWINLRNDLLGTGFAEAGQTAAAEASANLGSCRYRLRLQGGLPGGNSFVDVYAAAANDGSNDLPTGSVLATSDAVSTNSIPVGGAGGLITFAFSGANQIALTSGNRYVFMLRSTHAFGIGAEVAMRVSLFDPYAGGSMNYSGTGASFYKVPYPQMDQLPHLYSEIVPPLSTIHTAPHGSIIQVAMPSFPSSGEVLIGGGGSHILVGGGSGGLRTLLQEWVNDPAYTTGESLGLVMTAYDPEPSEDRSFDGTNAVLRISYRNSRNIYVI